ncbi:MAG: type II secretion system major pseudopilin GspG [Hyphomonadaceae bacterium]
MPNASLKPGRPNSSRRGETGFTLLEVLIVLTIIALVAVLVGPRLIAQLDRSKVTAAQVQIRSLASSMEAMRVDIGRYPTSQEGLDLLVRAPSGGRGAGAWRGPYLDADVPLDPWAGEYAYIAPKDEFTRPTILSLGADGLQGGSDLAADIRYGDAP